MSAPVARSVIAEVFAHGARRQRFRSIVLSRSGPWDAAKNICELGRLNVNFRALSRPARAHCCLTDEQFQHATGGG